MAIGSDGTAGQSLADFAADMFGDGMTSDPVDTDSTVAAGAPPAEHVEPTPTDDPEAPPIAERAGTPPADAAPSSADPVRVVSTSTTPEVDPLAGATSATYVVNGETRTYDGIKVLPELGGIIDADKLPDLMRRLGERDHLYETSQAQYRASQDLERLTQWEVSKPDGTKEILTGAPAIHVARVAHGNTLAELSTLKAALADPETFHAMCRWDEPAQRVVLDPAALRGLATQAELLGLKIQDSLRTRFAAQPQQAAPAATSPADIQAMAPSIVAYVVKQLAVTGLTDKDMATLAVAAPRFVRPATEADRQQNPAFKVGELLIDGALQDQVKHLADLRAETAKTTQAISQTVTRDAQTNAARLAAASRGRSATQPARVAPKPPVTAESTRAQESSDAFDMMENLAFSSLKGAFAR